MDYDFFSTLSELYAHVNRLKLDVITVFKDNNSYVLIYKNK